MQLLPSEIKGFNASSLLNASRLPVTIQRPPRANMMPPARKPRPVSASTRFLHGAPRPQAPRARRNVRSARAPRYSINAAVRQSVAPQTPPRGASRPPTAPPPRFSAAARTGDTELLSPGLRLTDLSSAAARYSAELNGLSSPQGKRARRARRARAPERPQTAPQRSPASQFTGRQAPAVAAQVSVEPPFASATFAQAPPSAESLDLYQISSVNPHSISAEAVMARLTSGCNSEVRRALQTLVALAKAACELHDRSEAGVRVHFSPRGRVSQEKQALIFRSRSSHEALQVALRSRCAHHLVDLFGAQLRVPKKLVEEAVYHLALYDRGFRSQFLRDGMAERLSQRLRRAPRGRYYALDTPCSASFSVMTAALLAGHRDFQAQFAAKGALAATIAQLMRIKPRHHSLEAIGLLHLLAHAVADNARALITFFEANGTRVARRLIDFSAPPTSPSVFRMFEFLPSPRRPSTDASTHVAKGEPCRLAGLAAPAAFEGSARKQRITPAVFNLYASEFVARLFAETVSVPALPSSVETPFRKEVMHSALAALEVHPHVYKPLVETVRKRIYSLDVIIPHT